MFAHGAGRALPDPPVGRHASWEVDRLKEIFYDPVLWDASRFTVAGVSIEDPESVIRDIGRRIAELRAEKGLTQEQVAEMLGIALRNFQRIERGHQNVTVKTMVAVASVLGVRAIDLMYPPANRELRIGRPPQRASSRPAETEKPRNARGARSRPPRRRA